MNPRFCPGISSGRSTVREGDVLRLRGGPESFQHGTQGDAHPGNHHRPRLDAAHAVDPLFELMGVDHVVEIEFPGLFALAGEAHPPRPRLEAARVPLRIALVGAELVEVVVTGDVLVGSELLVGRQPALLDVLEKLAHRVFVAGNRAGRGWREESGAAEQGGARSDAQSALHETPAISVDVFRRHFRRLDVLSLLDEHRSPPESLVRNRHHACGRAAAYCAAIVVATRSPGAVLHMSMPCAPALSISAERDEP